MGNNISLHEIENRYREMVMIHKSRAESFPEWTNLLELDDGSFSKTYHPIKLLEIRKRKSAASNSTTQPYISKGLERDQKGIHSTMPQA